MLCLKSEAAMKSGLRDRNNWDVGETGEPALEFAAMKSGLRDRNNLSTDSLFADRMMRCNEVRS